LRKDYLLYIYSSKRVNLKKSGKTYTTVPKEYSHLFLGQKLLKDLTSCYDTSLTSDIHIDPPSFLLGNTAPDLFFYDFPAFRFRVLAKLLHRGRGESLLKIIVSLIEKSKNLDTNSKLYSFCLGCLGHLAADMIWHPLVLKCCNACPKSPKAPQCPESASCHFRIESYLDILVAKYFGHEMKKRDFPKSVALFDPATRKLLGIFCREINSTSGCVLKCDPASTYRCLVTQVTFLTFFQIKPLYWVTLGVDLLTLRKFDQYQALFYPPDGLVNKSTLAKLSPGIKMLLSPDGKLLENHVELTSDLAKNFITIAMKQKSGSWNAKKAYTELLKLTLSSGVDGHLDFVF